MSSPLGRRYPLAANFELAAIHPLSVAICSSPGAAFP